jgi:hypothetical protein
MRTLKVELRNNNALRILKGLELANIIRLVGTDKKKENTKLSATLRGAISKQRAHELIEQLNQTRNEWQERNI